MTVNEWIYQTLIQDPNLNGISENLFFSVLPPDMIRSKDLAVYQLEVNEVHSCMNRDSIALTHRLQIKVLSDDGQRLAEWEDKFITAVDNLEHGYIRSSEFVRDNYLFDSYLNMHTMSLDFDLYISRTAIKTIDGIMSLKNYTWTAPRTDDQTDFVISTALEDEILEMQSCHVQTVFQYGNYTIVGTNVPKDTIRFLFPVDKNKEVHILYR